MFALRIDTGKYHQNVGSDLVVLGEVLEAVLLGYSIGLGLEPRVSLTKFSGGQAEAAGYRRDLGSMLRAVLTHELDRERIHPRRR